MTSALTGKRVLLTRTAQDNSAWAEQLRAAGLVPVEHACIEREVIAVDPEHMTSSLADCTWIVLPSPEAVRRLAAFAPLPNHIRIACVGPTSVQLARKLLGRYDLEAKAATMAGLCSELSLILTEDLPGEPNPKVMIAGAEHGIETSDELLRQAGATVQRWATYRTRPVQCAPGKAPLDLAELQLDAVFLGSPSALVGLKNTVNMQQLKAPLFTLGPTTSAAVRGTKLGQPIEAKTRSVGGLMHALAAYLRPQTSGNRPAGQRS